SSPISPPPRSTLFPYTTLFRSLGDYLAAKTNWEIVIPALDGHGEELDLEEASYETWLDETEQALIDLKANCDKLYVVGFSMGGMIAAYLAANYDVDKL